MERGASRMENRSLTGPTPRDRSSSGKPLAVFDVDGTLFRRGLLPELTRRLVDEGVFSEGVREDLGRDYYAWVERRGSYESYDNLVVELFQRELRGVSLKELRRCARAEVEDHGRRLHLYTSGLTQRLRGAGYFLLAISGSPEEILDIFLKPLGFDRAFGTVLAVDGQGRYTGERLSNPFEDKRRVLEAFLAETGTNLEGSVGVGDTLSDVGFLEVVEAPVAFNPNRALFEAALERRWPLVVERKDVIYNLSVPLEDPLLKRHPVGRMTPWQRAGARFSAVSYGPVRDSELAVEYVLHVFVPTTARPKDPISCSNLPLKTQ